MKTLAAFLAAASAAVAVAQDEERERTVRLHDPSTIVEGAEDGFWCFSTGHGVSILRRPEEGRWDRIGSIFDRGARPEWHAEVVPENRGHLWAPDVIRVGDRWLVYYSVSSFGRNTSAIGLASRGELDPDDPEEDWRDDGMVIRSRGDDSFNAIDPAVIMDDGRLWMSFGSFWEGIMLVELDPETGLMKDPEEEPAQLARAPEIEAPFIHKEGDWYYLFVNWGKCCRGEDSTYEIRVGRSREITGPYVDRDDAPMTEGGGTLVLDTEGRFIGPGHASIFENGGEEWLVHHFYDGEDRGRSKLRLVELEWREGWPVVPGE